MIIKKSILSCNSNFEWTPALLKKKKKKKAFTDSQIAIVSESVIFLLFQSIFKSFFHFHFKSMNHNCPHQSWSLIKHWPGQWWSCLDSPLFLEIVQNPYRWYAPTMSTMLPTHMDTKAMDLNKQSVFSPPPGNLYKTFTKPFFYLSFQDEPLTRIQITSSVNPELAHTDTHAHVYFKRWLEWHEYLPYKHTSEIDLRVCFTIINLW